MMVRSPAGFIGVSRLAVIAVIAVLASIVLSKCFILSFRNGRSHEEGRDYGCRTDGGGEESSFG